MTDFKELGGLERVINYHLDRHGVLASNVANAETPGYRAKDLTFDAALAKAESEAGVESAFAGSESPGTAVVVEDESARADDNGVRLEKAMAQISANRLRYETGVDIARRKLAMLKYAATDGGT